MTKYMLHIKGYWHSWGFIIKGNDANVEEWRKDGLEVEKIENIVPEWYVDAGLSIWLWCKIQDLLGRFQ